MSDLFRPIIGFENRTKQEVFDIMADRIHFLSKRVAELEEALIAIAAEIPRGGSDPLFNTAAEKLVFAALPTSEPTS